MDVEVTYGGANMGKTNKSTELQKSFLFDIAEIKRDRAEKQRAEEVFRKLRDDDRSFVRGRPFEFKAGGITKTVVSIDPMNQLIEIPIVSEADRDKILERLKQIVKDSTIIISTTTQK